MATKTEDFGTGPMTGKLDWINVSGKITDSSLVANGSTEYYVTVKNLLPYQLGPLAPDNCAFSVECWLHGGANDVTIMPSAPTNYKINTLDKGETETLPPFIVSANGAYTGTQFHIHTKLVRAGWPDMVCEWFYTNS